MKNDQLNDTGRLYKRGYLPHFDLAEITQHVTFRLADSLPRSVYRRLEVERQNGKLNEIEYYLAIDDYLDRNRGDAYLRHPQIADMICETIRKFDSVKYLLHAYVIMPNHGHILFTQKESYTLAEIMHSIKSFTANRANKILQRRGRFWSPEYFDRMIRDRVHFARVKEYIEMNPVKAGLCKEVAEWRWSSAYKG